MRLGVNIDHIATLRQARGGADPEPVFAALTCLAAGADAVVLHLREDRRHIQERDLYILRAVVKAKLNLEMSLHEEIVEIACKAKPDQVTLVPEKRQELTTEGGLDVVANFKKLKTAINKIKSQNIGVSLFIDPDKKQIDASKKLGIDKLELHTGAYANSQNVKDEDKHFRQLEAAVNYAKINAFQVFAGHGLNYNNVSRVAKIRGIEELNIGYAIICRAVFVGLSEAVAQMKALI